ncbi:MAG: sigma-54-dependent Fis family transcriptional regulator [Candidatus Riflebacteria bacterium]|nr:sigma-54-dependent Fis family transcriptional regulator [Candidatus Riflebacteria bacterium]
MNHATPRLLPHLTNLELDWEDGAFRIAAIPDWLAGYLGKPAAAFTGKSLEATLEPSIPGLLDLANRVLFHRRTVSDLPATATDHQGHSHAVSLSASYRESPEGRKSVLVSFDEFPLQRGPELPDLESATFHGLVGYSPSMQRVFNKIRIYGPSDAPVLVHGETGAGKEGVAAALHALSSRRQGPFVTVNCTAITETLFESELFGHEKGSFTGAIKAHRGRFERASGGTLFLDEIGDLPLPSQAKLLRVLEEEKIERVGSEQAVTVDVRIVAATNRNLEEASSRQQFRSDLFFRLNALQIRIPPLRERLEDIPLLVQHFVRAFNRKYRRQVVGLTREAMAILQRYQWPGNVRELRNLMERLFAETQTDLINQRALKEWIEERMAAARFARHGPDVTILPYRQAIELGMGGEAPAAPPPPAMAKPGEPRSDIDEAAIRRAFQEANGNITQAAARLGIHKATFYRYLKTFNLKREDL